MARPLIAALVLAASAPALQGPGPPIFSARAELVVLHVVVKDRTGAHVSDLPAGAFTVFENGRRQPIEFFAAQDAPATVGLLVDSSGSMVQARAQIARAAAAFVETSHAQDQIFALVFNDIVRTALASGSPAIGDPAAMRAALEASMVAGGRTALFDAVLEGLDVVSEGRHDRQALVIVSDGGDNASTATFDDVLRRLLVSNVAVYTVAFADPVQRDVSPSRLRRLARAAGGEAYEPQRIDEVGEVFRRIARDIRQTYTLGYAPVDTAPIGRIRRVEVDVSVPGLRGLTVRTREGYAPQEDR